MLAHYGYKDGSGDFFITINTESCNGCGDCANVCPSSILTVMKEDPNDPMRLEPVAVVVGDMKNRLKYACNPCKSSAAMGLPPCVKACRSGAVSHSW